eukprot:3125951-Rhodomonas_salina.1
MLTCARGPQRRRFSRSLAARDSKSNSSSGSTWVLAIIAREFERCQIRLGVDLRRRVGSSHDALDTLSVAF